MDTFWIPFHSASVFHSSLNIHGKLLVNYMENRWVLLLWRQCDCQQYEQNFIQMASNLFHWNDGHGTSFSYQTQLIPFVFLQYSYYIRYSVKRFIQLKIHICLLWIHYLKIFLQIWMYSFLKSFRSFWFSIFFLFSLLLLMTSIYQSRSVLYFELLRKFIEMSIFQLTSFAHFT